MSYGERRGGFRGDSRFGGPKPVEVGKEYEVQVAELSRKGDGLARIQGFVIFVKGGKVGEKAKIRVINVGERFATAEKVGGSTTPDAQPAQEQKEPKQVAPPVAEADKPELQDWKSKEDNPSN